MHNSGGTNKYRTDLIDLNPDGSQKVRAYELTLVAHVRNQVDGKEYQFSYDPEMDVDSNTGTLIKKTKKKTAKTGRKTAKKSRKK